MAISEPTEVVPVTTGISFLQWTPVVAGAFVTSAIATILTAFGTAIGLGVASSSPTWRQTSSALALASGLYLLLAAIVSFGVGGYISGRLRERWSDASASREMIDFRDGTHGIVGWALAVIITALLAAAAVNTVASKAAPSTSSTSASAGEPLVAYELDQLLRGDRRPGNEVPNVRAEAARILLTAGGRQGVTPSDREYLAQLVSSRTGIASPEAEHRVDAVITAAATAIKKARRSAVILGFSIAAALLAGAAAAWYASCRGGRDRDSTAPLDTWFWRPHA